MNDHRKAIVKRLQRLLSMTLENGASENEALVAAEKAAALMREHNLSYTDAQDLRDEECVNDARPWFRGAEGRMRAGPIPEVRACLSGISALCNVEHAWNGWTGQLTMFGYPQDVEAAHYFVRIIDGAMEREWKAYLKTKTSKATQRARTAFKRGMAMRIAQRIRALAYSQNQQATSNCGTDLIVLKGEVVKSRFAESFPNIRGSVAPARLRDGAAAAAGVSAGNRVSLNRGIDDRSVAEIEGGA